MVLLLQTGPVMRRDGCGTRTPIMLVSADATFGAMCWLGLGFCKFGPMKQETTIGLTGEFRSHHIADASSFKGSAAEAAGGFQPLACQAWTRSLLALSWAYEC